MQNNIRKPLVGHTRYVLFEQASAIYEIRNAPSQTLRADLVCESFKARCPFSLQSKVRFALLNRVIEPLIADGSVDRIMAGYR